MFRRQLLAAASAEVGTDISEGAIKSAVRHGYIAPQKTKSNWRRFGTDDVAGLVRYVRERSRIALPQSHEVVDA
tara:strand:- start:4581 stop:4802 length:222 start_codon:yes stop_codon:yes gene_type:complete